MLKMECIVFNATPSYLKVMSGFGIRAGVEVTILLMCSSLKFRQFIDRLYISSSNGNHMRTRETEALHTNQL